MNNIERLTKLLEDTVTEYEFREVLQQVSENNHHQWCGVLLFKPISAMQQDVLAYGQIPDDVKRHICSDGSLYKYCVNQCRPITANNIFGHHHQHLDNILLVPLKGCASNCGCLVICVGVGSQSMMKQLGWYWSIVGPYFYDAAQRASDIKSTVISKRELECISWASDGKTSWEISQILNITESTVNFHLANCISKTDSANRQQAIAKCLLQGQLVQV